MVTTYKLLDASLVQKSLNPYPLPFLLLLTAAGLEIGERRSCCEMFTSSSPFSPLMSSSQLIF